MTITEARDFVDTEIAKLERCNQGRELRPWVRDACPAATEHWGLVQQRIALSRPRPSAALCCKSLNLRYEHTEAQRAARTANWSRLQSKRHARTAQGEVFLEAQATDRPSGMNFPQKA